MILIRQIRTLLYEQGFTIGGARQRMAGQSAPEMLEEAVAAKPLPNTHQIREMIEEIEEALGYLA